MRASGWAGALATVLVCGAAFADGPWAAARPAALPLFLLLAILGGAAVCGRRAAAAFAPGFDEEELTVAGAALGLGLAALGMLALAAAGLLRPWAAAALLGAMWAAGAGELGAAAGAARSMLRRAAAAPWLCALAGLPLLAALWHCLVPPHQYDSLVYHLALPQAYVAAGRLHAPAGIVYSHFPQNGEMLYTLALLLGSDALAQMLTWAAAALTVAWLAGPARRITPAAPWAAALVATHSAVLLMSSTTYVEPLVMLWTLAAVLSFEASGDGARRGPLALAAVFTGLALGTKYYAGLLAAALALRLLWARRVRECALFSTLAIAVFGPWLVKNAVFAGNPVFPFLYQLFPATAVGWTREAAAGYFAVLTEYGHKGSWLKDLVSLPVLLFRNPLRFGGGMDVLGDVGWTLLLWLWPFGLWAAAKGRAPRGLAAFTALYFAGWFSTGVVLRFLTAAAPALALVGAAGARSWLESAPRAARAAALAAAGLAVAANLFLAAFVHGVFDGGGVLLGLESRREFLSRRLDYFPCAEKASSLPPESRVLVVGEQRGYYLDRPHRASTVHAPNLWVRRADEAGSPKELARALSSDGFSHLLFVPREAARLGAALGGFTERGAANWRGLEPLLRVDFRGPACLLASLEAR